MTGWLIWLGIVLLILILRNDDKIAAAWRGRPFQGMDDQWKPRAADEAAWSRGKQVTFMEPEPSAVVKVASRSIHDSLAMANADPSAYWLGPRDRATGLRPIQTPGRGIRNSAGYD